MAARKTVKQDLEQLEEMCAEHFPLGWKHVPAEHVGVSCEHGGWFRAEPVANTAVPAAPAEPETPPEPTNPEA